VQVRIHSEHARSGLKYRQLEKLEEQNGQVVIETVAPEVISRKAFGPLGF
jgi:hypothetical protein